LATGSGQIGTGLQSLTTGNQKLATSLGQAGVQVKKVHATDLTYAQIAKPVTTKQHERDTVPNNGTAMAPYMMAVSTYVGAMAMCLMYDIYTPRRKPKSRVSWWASKMSVLTLEVMTQTTLMYGLMMLINGLNPVHPGATYLVVLMTSLTFVSIINLLNLLFGQIGSFFALILLVLQLGGAAGTYPIQLSNSFFEAIHPYLPITYAVNGLRSGLMIGNSVLPSVAVLAGITVVLSGLTIAFFSLKRKKVSTIEIAEL